MRFPHTGCALRLAARWSALRLVGAQRGAIAAGRRQESAELPSCTGAPTGASRRTKGATAHAFARRACDGVPLSVSLKPRQPRASNAFVNRTKVMIERMRRSSSSAESRASTWLQLSRASRNLAKRVASAKRLGARLARRQRSIRRSAHRCLSRRRRTLNGRSRRVRQFPDLVHRFLCRCL